MPHVLRRGALSSFLLRLQVQRSAPGGHKCLPPTRASRPPVLLLAHRACPLPSCLQGGEPKMLSYCSDMERSTSTLRCAGFDDQEACPDWVLIKPDGVNATRFNLMALRHWETACPDPQTTTTECSSELRCFAPPEEEPAEEPSWTGEDTLWARKLLAPRRALRAAVDAATAPAPRLDRNKSLPRAP